MHDESDVRVTKKFNEERHQQVKSSPQEEVLKVYSRRTPFTLQMDPLLSYLEKHQDRVPA